MTMRGLIILCACAALSSALAGEEVKKDHELARAAASMKPGEWKEIKAEGYDKAFLQDTRDGVKPVHQIFQYTNKIHWYPKTQELYFMGAGHASMGKFVTYSAGKNAWRQLETPEQYRKKGRSGMSHTYENTTIDLENDWMLRQSHMESIIERYDLTEGKWIDPIPATSKGGHRSATEYFPEMKTYVRYETQTKKPLMRWDREGKKWVAFADVDMSAFPRLTHPAIEYNPVHKVMLFGGGNECNKLFILDEEGKTRAIKSPPVLTVNSTHINALTVDPAGGEFLLYAKEKGKTDPGPSKFYAYNVEKDEWRELTDPTPLGDPKGKVATPVEDHGVILFCTFSPTRMWLYKHAAAE